MEKVSLDLAISLRKDLITKTKKQLLNEVIDPEYAEKMKDFTKDEILECLLINYPEIL